MRFEALHKIRQDRQRSRLHASEGGGGGAGCVLVAIGEERREHGRGLLQRRIVAAGGGDERRAVAVAEVVQDVEDARGEGLVSPADDLPQCVARVARDVRVDVLVGLRTFPGGVEELRGRRFSRQCFQADHAILAVGPREQAPVRGDDFRFRRSELHERAGRVADDRTRRIVKRFRECRDRRTRRIAEMPERSGCVGPHRRRRVSLERHDECRNRLRGT